MHCVLSHCNITRKQINIFNISTQYCVIMPIMKNWYIDGLIRLRQQINVPSIHAHRDAFALTARPVCLIAPGTLLDQKSNCSRSLCNDTNKIESMIRLSYNLTEYTTKVNLVAMEQQIMNKSINKQNNTTNTWVRLMSASIGGKVPEIWLLPNILHFGTRWENKYNILTISKQTFANK
jgi:hypothetical protein